MFDDITIPTGDELKRLKKALYVLWEKFNDDFYFICGLTISRPSFKKFYQTALDYGISPNTVDHFIALNLKRYDCMKLRTSDSSFISNEEVKVALYLLKHNSQKVRILPYVLKFHPSIRKYFLDGETVKIGRLAKLYLDQLKLHGLDYQPLIDDFSARQYFKNTFKYTDKEFDNVALSIFQARFTFKNGKRYFYVSSLAELEEIIISESCVKLYTEDELIETLLPFVRDEFKKDFKENFEDIKFLFKDIIKPEKKDNGKSGK